MKSLEEYVLTIPDFPKPGIMFRDLTSVLADADGFHLAIDTLKKMLEGVDFDVVVGPEARGFILGSPIRKKGKLPRDVVRQEYDLEYGKAEIEMHTDSIKPGQKVIIVDDLIATGGTTAAAVKLIERLGGKVTKILFLMELAGLEGRKSLEGYDVETAIVYPGK